MRNVRMGPSFSHRHIIKPHKSGNGLLPAVGALGAEVVAAHAAHDAACLHLPHGVRSPGGDGGVVGEGGGGPTKRKPPAETLPPGAVSNPLFRLDKNSLLR